jgi:3-hydroxyacyl-CoA dehydrogenase
MATVNTTLSTNIAIIQLDNPPLNTFGFALRVSLADAINQAVANESVKAIILMGNDKVFSGGADITEFGKPLSIQEPHLLTLIDLIENCAKPVIAAISGVCMGGGAEISLACHFRVALPDATIALPEVKLGLIPGAGGTQRLPRLAGVENALNMIVSGNPVPAAMLKGTALFDEIIEGDLTAGALAFAAKIIAEKRPIKRARDIKINYPLAEGYFEFARNAINTVSKNYPAPLKAVEAIAAAVSMPFEKGNLVERECFLSLMMSPESRSLRHLFFAERAVSKIADVPSDIKTRPINQVAVIGAGTMGGGITMNFLNAGIPVTIIETEAVALERGVTTIRKNYENSVKKGKLTPENLERCMQLLKPSLQIEDVKDADLIIEAVFEDMSVKQTVFKKLDAIAKPGAILASNTSTLDINQIATVTSRPQDVVGLHFFSPANIMKLLEVVRASATAKEVLATVMQLAKKIKKIAVVVGVCDGFVGNRMLFKYADAAQQLLLEGASPYQIDQALEKWGMVMGPYRMADLAGNDIGWHVRKRLYAANPTMPHDIIADRLCEMGRFGQKTGLGYYRYEAGGRDALPDSAVLTLIDEARQKAGISPRKISDQDIVERCIYALVNEGARILDEGIAARASDIDIIYIYGYGFPAYRGGPMRYADEVGLYSVLQRLQHFTAEPARLIQTLVNEHKSLTSE